MGFKDLLVQDAKFLSTPSARRATIFRPFRYVKRSISIHALREEGDRYIQDTGSAVNGISIHALREEGDRAMVTSAQRLSNFYPRPPRGGRRFEGVVLSRDFTFLSTPSARRATLLLFYVLS